MQAINERKRDERRAKKLKIRFFLHNYSSIQFNAVGTHATAREIQSILIEKN